MHNDYSPLIPKRHNAYNVQYNIDLDTVQVDSEHKLQTLTSWRVAARCWTRNARYQYEYSEASGLFAARCRCVHVLLTNVCVCVCVCVWLCLCDCVSVCVAGVRSRCQRPHDDEFTTHSAIESTARCFHGKEIFILISESAESETQCLNHLFISYHFDFFNSTENVQEKWLLEFCKLQYYITCFIYK